MQLTDSQTFSSMQLPPSGKSSIVGGGSIMRHANGSSSVATSEERSVGGPPIGLQSPQHRPNDSPQKVRSDDIQTLYKKAAVLGGSGMVVPPIVATRAPPPQLRRKQQPDSSQGSPSVAHALPQPQGPVQMMPTGSPILNDNTSIQSFTRDLSTSPSHTLPPSTQPSRTAVPSVAMQHEQQQQQQQQEMKEGSPRYQPSTITESIMRSISMESDCIWSPDEVKLLTPIILLKQHFALLKQIQDRGVENFAVRTSPSTVLLRASVSLAFHHMETVLLNSVLVTIHEPILGDVLRSACDVWRSESEQETAAMLVEHLDNIEAMLLKRGQRSGPYVSFTVGSHLWFWVTNREAQSSSRVAFLAILAVALIAVLVINVATGSLTQLIISVLMLVLSVMLLLFIGILLQHGGVFSPSEILRPILSPDVEWFDPEERVKGTASYRAMLLEGMLVDNSRSPVVDGEGAGGFVENPLRPSSGVAPHFLVNSLPRGQLVPNNSLLTATDTLWRQRPCVVAGRDGNVASVIPVANAVSSHSITQQFRQQQSNTTSTGNPTVHQSGVMVATSDGGGASGANMHSLEMKGSGASYAKVTHVPASLSTQVPGAAASASSSTTPLALMDMIRRKKMVLLCDSDIIANYFPILVVDRERNEIVTVTESALDLLSCTAAQMIGTKGSQLFTCEYLGPAKASAPLCRPVALKFVNAKCSFPAMQCVARRAAHARIQNSSVTANDIHQVYNSAGEWREEFGSSSNVAMAVQAASSAAAVANLSAGHFTGGSQHRLPTSASPPKQQKEDKVYLVYLFSEKATDFDRGGTMGRASLSEGPVGWKGGASSSALHSQGTSQGMMQLSLSTASAAGAHRHSLPSMVPISMFNPVDDATRETIRRTIHSISPSTDVRFSQTFPSFHLDQLPMSVLSAVFKKLLKHDDHAMCYFDSEALLPTTASPTAISLSDPGLLHNQQIMSNHVTPPSSPNTIPKRCAIIARITPNIKNMSVTTVASIASFSRVAVIAHSGGGAASEELASSIEAVGGKYAFDERTQTTTLRFPFVTVTSSNNSNELGSGSHGGMGKLKGDHESLNGSDKMEKTKKYGLPMVLSGTSANDAVLEELNHMHKANSSSKMTIDHSAAYASTNQHVKVAFFSTRADEHLTVSLMTRAGASVTFLTSTDALEKYIAFLEAEEAEVSEDKSSFSGVLATQRAAPYVLDLLLVEWQPAAFSEKSKTLQYIAKYQSHSHATFVYARAGEPAPSVSVLPLSLMLTTNWDERGASHCMMISRMLSAVVRFNQANKKNPQANNGDNDGMSLPAMRTPAYTLGRRLGSGGFGDVFEVRLDISGGLLAMKRIFVAEDEEGRGLFEEVKREVSMMAMLEHRNIVRLSHCTAEDHCVCIFMELCESSLSQQLRRQPSATLTEASATVTMSSLQLVQVVNDIVNGLVFLHSRGVVHRDIKPENILFRDGVAKISDLGTAAMERESRPLRNMKGTLAYMAPEVVLGEPYGRPCDIWAVGCILAEMIGVPLLHLFQMSVPKLARLYSSMGPNDVLDVQEIPAGLVESMSNPSDAPQLLSSGIPPDITNSGSAEFNNPSTTSPSFNSATKLQLPSDVVILLRSCFARDPLKRISAEELLSHPVCYDEVWMAQMRIAVAERMPRELIGGGGALAGQNNGAHLAQFPSMDMSIESL